MTSTMKQQLHEVLSPFAYWAQTENQITLKVDLHDVNEPDIVFERRLVKFTGHGCGAKGQSIYTFNLDLYDDIDVKAAVFKVHETKIEFVITKSKLGWWPRLIAQPQKPHWLKIDFDRWRSEEDADNTNETRSVIEDYPGVTDYVHNQEYGYRKERGKHVYLIFYNLFQFIGFLYILLVIGIRFYRDGSDSITSMYQAVGNAFKFCQLLQYLEVMHPIFGYSKGGALMPFLQVSGRAFILFIMIDSEERMQTKPVVSHLFVIWSLVEIVRYPYYITTIINRPISILTWLRYTIWIPLYPLGILCESIVILRNIPYFEETQRFSLTMPNKYNAIFDMPTILKLYLLLLILPGFYLIMNHMSKARLKHLGKRKFSKDD